MNGIEYLRAQFSMRAGMLSKQGGWPPSADVDRELEALSASVAALCAFGLVPPEEGLEMVREFRETFLAPRLSMPRSVEVLSDRSHVNSSGPPELLEVAVLTNEIGPIGCWDRLRLVSLQRWTTEFEIRYVGFRSEQQSRPSWAGPLELDVWDDSGTIYHVRGHGVRSYRETIQRGEWILAPRLSESASRLILAFGNGPMGTVQTSLTLG